MLAQILGQLRDGLLIARQAHLQSDPPVRHVAHQFVDVAPLVGDRLVTNVARTEQPGAVANAVGVAIGDRLEDGLGPIIFAGVHRLAEEVLVSQLVSGLVVLRRKATFLARQIQPHHRQAVVFRRRHRRAREFERRQRIDLGSWRGRQRLEVGLVVLAEHGQEEAQGTNNDPRLKAWQRARAHRRVAIDLALGPLDALTDSFQHLPDPERTAHVQLRRKADLGVEDVLGAAIEAQLVGDPLKRFCILQTGDGELESAQVFRQVLVGPLEDQIQQARRGA